jgi:dTDP-glucose 4,6-dehydratase
LPEKLKRFSASTLTDMVDAQSTPVSVGYQPGVAIDDLRLIMEKTPAEVWQALRGQRIFITGGTGFVGCWLLESLIWANERLGLNLNLTVLSRAPDAFRIKAPHLAMHPIVNLVQGDVSDLQDIDSPFDTIIHAATDVANVDENQLATFDSIVGGTRQTLALAKRSGARRYLLTSSGAVYGRQPSDLTHIPDDYPGAPDTMSLGSAYGQAKRVSEWLSQCHAQQSGLEVSIARCFALVGPYLPLDAHFAVGNFIRDGLLGNTIEVSGDGTAYRSYLYAADMAVWLLTILINGRVGQTYNLGSEREITIGELASYVADCLGGASKVSIASTPVMGNPAQRYVPNADKAKKELRLREYTDLQSAIRKTSDWALRRSSTTANSGF